MVQGDDTVQQATWFRVVRASVSTRVVAAVCACSLLFALGLAAWVALTPASEREQWVYELVLTFLRTTPPFDAILAQLPAERMASVQTRSFALVRSTLSPVLAAAAVGATLVALTYALTARYLRNRWRAVSVPRTAAPAFQGLALLTFLAIAVLAVAVHMPYALQSIRYDEDGASLMASSGWLNWANNLAGWQNHVAASLSIRLSTALFGMNDLSVRMPAVLASSLSLALLCAFLEQRFSKWLGWVLAASFMALPLWAEQTSLARGYGLTFSASAWMVIGLIRLHDEGDHASSATMGYLFASVFVGCLAHFFFVFLAAGLFVTLLFTRRIGADVRSAALWLLVLAGIVPALSFAVGLPGIVGIVRASDATAVSVVVERFREELSFRHAGPAGTALAIFGVLLSSASALLLPRAARWPFFALMSVTLLVPLLGSTSYVYPRYYLHASPFLLTGTAWFVSIYLLRDRALPNLLVCGALAALYVSTQPWNLPVFVDIREASKLARAEVAAHGEHFATDSFLSSSMRFYNGDPGRIINVSHPIPDNVERILVGAPPADLAARVPAGFEIEQRLPGTEHDILLLGRVRR